MIKTVFCYAYPSSALFVIALLILFIGVAYFIRAYRHNHITTGLTIAIAVSLTIRLFTSSDHYLHDWDEKYHALVAKHLADHPLTPMLYEDPVRPYDYHDWTNNHIWLSKPPIGLWGMALSIKLFGTHEYAVRLPALLYSLLSVLLVFQIGRSLFDDRTALIAAMLTGTHGMLTDLASGRLSSDGIETCFLFVMNVGWYYLFKIRTTEFTWMNYIVFGAITGMAFLTKWQPSLLLLVVSFTLHIHRANIFRTILGHALSLVTAAIPVLLWYQHCHQNFPAETNHMMQAIFHPLHLNDPHNDATWYTYPTVFGNYFGYTTYLLIAYVVYLSIKTKERKWIVLSAWIIIPFFIFQIAEIKRGTYLMIFAPAIFLIIGYFLQHHITWRKIPLRLLATISVIFIAGYSIEKLYLFSSKSQTTPDWTIRIKEAHPQPGSVIYNEPHYIEMMFYHEVTAYP
ncbi:MAG: glycosyltransferase family 39 protein [Flavobacteriales bacterium]|nr:glycosyltransferase family 39 protein [Flavobacteriales bacterium]